MNQLVPLLAKQFEGVFDELYSQKDFVQKVVLEEEVSFLRTLASGIQKLEKYCFDEVASIDGIKDENGHFKVQLSGLFAFELYDTYGFPIDLTELIVKEKNLQGVDILGFTQYLQKQKDRSRAATAIDTEDWVAVNEGDEVEFVGYDEWICETKILKYRKVTAKGKTQFQLVLNPTPFYAESGGQVGDFGLLTSENEEIIITDTKKENGLIVHFTDALPKQLDANFIAKIDVSNRILTEDNAENLRFDFSHFSKVTDEEIKAIEAIVNEKIRANISLKEERNVPYQQALDSGVTALFGEKYGDFVRVITFDDAYSKELCGGTHVRSTGQIGYFKIISESAVAAGVRRIEAFTAVKAEAYIREQDELLKGLKELLKNPNDLTKTVAALIEENQKLKKEMEKSALEKASGLKDELKAKAQLINGINFIAEMVDLPNAEAIKNLSYQLKDVLDNVYVVLASTIDEKPLLSLMISENLVKEKGLNAGTIIRELAKEIEGGGGGQPFYATAGGKKVAGLANALAKAKNFIA
jgi:alanyl-tRNA synthetase